MATTNREQLNSRLGFLLLAAGCAIGLGNIWRFPFVAGQYGGAVFVLLYLLFLVIIGFPVLVMELAVGRGAQRDLVGAVDILAVKHHTAWKRIMAVIFSGNFVLMMFYTTVCGWMMVYAYHYLVGNFAGISKVDGGTAAFFGEFVSSPWQMVICMLLSVAGGSGVCMLGLKNGVERITKLLMLGLFVVLLALVVNSLKLPGAGEGLKFYLSPVWPESGKAWLEIAIAASGQAFFTLSLGVGSMAIFGSYIGKRVSLTNEAVYIIIIDTLVALLAGLVIFPACATYNVPVGAGPQLVFITLPNVFDNMAGGRWWGLAFFLFMSMAALTTVIAVFENIVALLIDEGKIKRWKAGLIAFAALAILSLPCALGFNVLSWVQPFGAGSNVLDFEDFLLSDALLPLGALLLVLFCTRRYGWTWKNFVQEANTGSGIKYPAFARYYIAYFIPLFIVFLFVMAYYNRFFR